MQIGEIQLEQIGEVVTLSRTLKSYKNEGELCFVAASYDEDGVMTYVAQDKKTVNARTTYTFSVDINCDVFARIMLWGGASGIEPFSPKIEYTMQTVLLSAIEGKEGTNYGSVDATMLE